MSKTVNITSPAQLSSLLSKSKLVVVDFYADWCGPCKAIAPIYEQLSAQLSRQDLMTFTKVDVDAQQMIAQKYGITAMPTFMVFKNGNEVAKIRGANVQELSSVVKKLAAEVESGGTSSAGFGEGSSSGGKWRGADLPRGYDDVTDQVDRLGLDLLNSDTEFAGAAALFDLSKPSCLEGGGRKGKSAGAEVKPDWVESDTDEQLMLYIPFQSTLKIHTIQITSLPPSGDDADDETPTRPTVIRLFTNRSHNLGFEEAEDIPATQSIELKDSDWDPSTGTAKLELRFVKFQNVTSVVVFIERGGNDSEKTRLDRIRIIGESGERRAMGKLEKVGADD